MDRRHHPLFPHRVVASFAAVALVVSACGGSENSAEDSEAIAIATTAAPTVTAETVVEQTADEDRATLFPNVLAVDATRANDGTWTFSVTLSSPYDSPDRYADAWRVVSPDGTELGFRLLTHDHANEQPFTRSHSGIEIPDGVTSVTIEGRDQANGWGGEFLEFELPI